MMIKHNYKWPYDPTDPFTDIHTAVSTLESFSCSLLGLALFAFVLEVVVVVIGVLECCCCCPWALVLEEVGPGQGPAVVGLPGERGEAMPPEFRFVKCAAAAGFCRVSTVLRKAFTTRIWKRSRGHGTCYIQARKQNKC